MRGGTKGRGKFRLGLRFRTIRAGDPHSWCGQEKEAWASATCPCLVERGKAVEIPMRYKVGTLLFMCRGRTELLVVREWGLTRKKKTHIPPQAHIRAGTCSRSHSKLGAELELSLGFISHHFSSNVR